MMIGFFFCAKMARWQTVTAGLMVDVTGGV
jgi:hypothetical protein